MAKHLRFIVGVCLALIGPVVQIGPRSISSAGIVMAAGSNGNQSIRCLTDNIYYEAAHEPYAGKVAVGQVVLNRGGDVCTTVHAWHHNATGQRVAEFSWTLGRAWRAPGPVDHSLYLVCAMIARGLLDGSIRSMMIDSRVKWYHTRDVAPDWHRKFYCRIGHHLFYY